MDQESVPKKSSFGNKFSSFWYWAETLNKLNDTQTGFRAYPVESVAKKRWFTKRFEFEIEVIVRLAWDRVPAYEVPVSVKYEDDRVSHFRPFLDFARISLLNTVLFTLALLFFLPRKIIQTVSISSIKRQFKAELQKNASEPAKMALSISVGLFFGIFPIWGFQMLVAFTVASLFKLNRVVVLLSSNISFPPLIPFVIIISYEIGALFVENPIQLPSFDSIDKETIYMQIHQYIIGSVILAFAAAIVGFLIAYPLLKLKNKEEH